MSEQMTQALLGQWIAHLAELNRQLKAKDNQIREMNAKLKEQETKLQLSEKLNEERAAEKNAAEANARAIIKNAEQILAPIKAAKEGPASKQSPLKRHFEVNFFNKQATAVNSQI
ncbi:hypothetical protein Ddc_24093 [Ditylenchus destructor]|nr:hypothetical protein Ddc_24093 [Ditylenchus destructor]